MANNYIDPKQLNEEVRKSQAQDRMTEELANMVLLIVRNCSTKFNVEVDADEVGQYAVLTVMRYLHHLDPDRSCFSYITNIVKQRGYHIKRSDAQWYKSAGSELYYEGPTKEGWD